MGFFQIRAVFAAFDTLGQPRFAPVCGGFIMRAVAGRIDEFRFVDDWVILGFGRWALHQ
jgi:hypothetical protein